MMMKHLLSCLLLLGAASGPAQFLSYNFQDYKQADTRITWLQLDPVLIGTNETRLADPFNNTVKTNDFSMAVNLSYGIRQNRRAFQDELVMILGVNPHISDREQEDGLVINNTDMRNTFSGAWLRDNYNEADTKFWGWQIATSGGFFYNKMKNSDGFYRKRRSASWRQEAGIRLGIGRIENITNAWHAQRILNRLHFIGVTGREITHVDINQLGHLIDELRAERVYDGRLTYIAQMRILDDYLMEELDLRPEDQMKYFVELNDMWAFGISENRLKGQKWTLLLGGIYDLFDLHEEDDDTFNRDTHLSYYGPRASLSLLKAMPIKRDFQVNVTATVDAYYFLSIDQFNNIGQLMDKALIVNPRLDILTSFYPTTRTEYTLSGTLRSYNRRGELLGTDEVTTENEIGFSGTGQARYWFSPRTNLSAAISYRYNVDLPDPLFVPGSDAWRLFYRISLSHDFF